MSSEYQNKLPKVVKEMSKKYGLELPENDYDGLDFWKCHGNWILKHNGCEKIAMKENITFDEPKCNFDVAPNIALMITGHKKDEDGNILKTEWSFGEACGRNTKMPYWWAMAEKRGKDRVILKLINAYEQGVYSSSEADEWNELAKLKEIKTGSNSKIKKENKTPKINLKDLEVGNPKALENVAKLETKINGDKEKPAKLEKWEEDIICEQLSNQPDYADIK
tara:strand:- start:19474 stop:20139 length:666 start_codon:yes stop_codon:yes gene_type:complete